VTLSPTSSRFTQVDADALYIADSLLDAKGDLIAASAADTAARLAVGTNGQFLTAQSGQATGLLWATSAGILTELFDETLVGDVASIDSGAGGFSTSLDHLLILVLVRTSEATVFSSATLRFNNDSSAIYDAQYIRGRNVTATVGVQAAGTGVSCVAPGDSVAATVFGGWCVLVPAYAQTVAQKTVMQYGGWAEDTAAEEEAGVRIGRWRNTAAISRVQLVSGSGNLRTGSRMTIYGLG